ncbi:hypothetical protein EDB81DRAFT_430717 [Dactylonectria macrodidyma]|uniref:Uncharacterized protein n=1 Tax=Dactylonectria macrodidyma TaxID=307937 RepID=A0A9P9CXK1_9HYPO|nr:hypothetical protein EDB81DRAFT_430717 [Dactylonectria macrodidyma]
MAPPPIVQDAKAKLKSCSQPTLCHSASAQVSVTYGIEPSLQVTVFQASNLPTRELEVEWTQKNPTDGTLEDFKSKGNSLCIVEGTLSSTDLRKFVEGLPNSSIQSLIDLDFNKGSGVDKIDMVNTIFTILVTCVTESKDSIARLALNCWAMYRLATRVVFLDGSHAGAESEPPGAVACAQLRLYGLFAWWELRIELEQCFKDPITDNASELWLATLVLDVNDEDVEYDEMHREIQHMHGIHPKTEDFIANQGFDVKNLEPKNAFHVAVIAILATCRPRRETIIENSQIDHKDAFKESDHDSLLGKFLCRSLRRALEFPDSPKARL